MELIHKKESEITEAAAEEINHALKDWEDTPVLLMFSGGSALGLLNYLEIGLLKENITVTVLDERYTFDKDESNFAQIESSSIWLSAGLRHKVDPSPHPDESLTDTANRFEKDLREWRDKNPNGKILITQGLGVDGHTAGILPFCDSVERFNEVFVDGKWVVGYRVDPSINPFTKRITVTPEYLTDEVDRAIMFVIGDEKKHSLQKVQEKGEISDIPGRVIHKMKAVKVFTSI